MDTLINVLIAGASFYIGGKLLSGVEMKDFLQCILVALVVGLLDYTLGTFLKIITLGLLSFSIFTWFLNAILILIADWFLPGFKVKNFWWALGLAAIVSIATSLLSGLLT
jgi:putative membrane protein